VVNAPHVVRPPADWQTGFVLTRPGAKFLIRNFRRVLGEDTVEVTLRLKKKKT
jgi:hypothetical protein